MTSDISHNRRPSSSHEFNEFITVNSTRGNPLASKVSSVLSESYADSDIKDALILLDKRKWTNTPAKRRQFRYDVQREVIESNGDVIRGLGNLAEQLRGIGTVIAALNKACNEIKEHVSVAQRETAPILQEVSVIMIDKDEVETKQDLLRVFTTHFIISEDNLVTLTSSAEPVNDDFFALLARAKKIQKDCEILLGTESQRLGLEITEQISKAINGAFQKLYRWIQREFKSLNLENPQISSSIRKALHVLAERPSLFQNCLDFFAEARENILSDSFYTALSGKSVEGDLDISVKPIELAAHDPLRYVGDMLAWTHSATVSEKEALEVLFTSNGNDITDGIQTGRKSEPWNQLSEVRGEVSALDGRKALNQLVDRDVSGVASVLRRRIGQAIHSHEETIMAYKIANLLNFYRVTFSKILGEDSILLDSISTLEDSALSQFRMLVRDHVAGLQADSQAATEDLAPPEFLHDGLKQLTAIMETHETSLTSSDGRETDFQDILAIAFDPFINACHEIAKYLEAPKNSIFSINCILASKNTLSQFRFTKQRISVLENDFEKNAANLIEHQYDYLLNKSGLQPLLRALSSFFHEKEDIKKILSLKEFQTDSLIRSSEVLDNFLPTGLMDAIENLSCLQDSRLARETTEAAAQRFCEDFDHLEQTLIATDEIRERAVSETNIVPLRNVFPRTVDEVKVLLS